jgi:hypothetical protein
MSQSIEPEVVNFNDRVFKRMKIPDPNKLRFISCGSLVGMGLGGLLNFPWWLSIILIVMGLVATWKANPFVEL